MNQAASMTNTRNTRVSNMNSTSPSNIHPAISGLGMS